MRRAALVAALAVGVARPAAAHRLDEYLQATTLQLASGRLVIGLRLAPGLAVVPRVLRMIDIDGDGVLSLAEQRAYAAQVLRDIIVTADGRVLSPRLDSLRFPGVAELRDGAGEIVLRLVVELPAESAKRIAVENFHQPAISAYLMNALVPEDPDLRITSQRRNFTQSKYEVSLDHANGDPSLPLFGLIILAAGGLIELHRRWNRRLRVRLAFGVPIAAHRSGRAGAASKS